MLDGVWGNIRYRFIKILKVFEGLDIVFKNYSNGLLIFFFIEFYFLKEILFRSFKCKVDYSKVVLIEERKGEIEGI